MSMVGTIAVAGSMSPLSCAWRISLQNDVADSLGPKLGSCTNRNGKFPWPQASRQPRIIAGKRRAYSFGVPSFDSPWYQMAPRIRRPSSGTIRELKRIEGEFALPGPHGSGGRMIQPRLCSTWNRHAPVSGSDQPFPLEEHRLSRPRHAGVVDVAEDPDRHGVAARAHEAVRVSDNLAAYASHREHPAESSRLPRC